MRPWCAIAAGVAIGFGGGVWLSAQAPPPAVPFTLALAGDSIITRPGDRTAPAEFLVAFAHAMIDAGAGVFVGRVVIP